MEILIQYGFRAIAGVIIFTFFEYCKALISTTLGDNLPRQKGKLVPNPVKFIEPIGFLIFLFSGFGWSSPVETSPMYYKNRKAGIILTHLLPIIFCIVLGNVAVVLSKIVPNDMLFIFFKILGHSFVAIAVFNIIPVYPMAGSWIFRTLVSPNTAMKYSQYENIILMVLSFGVISGILLTPLNLVVNLLLLR